MSILINPTLSTLLDTQLTNLSYILRDGARVSGEYAGLPQSVPNDRKIDYLVRHIHAIGITAVSMQGGFLLGDQYYSMPHYVNLLGLDKLKDLYTPNSLHLPAGVTPKAIQNISPSQFPIVLRDKLFGTLVNPRSYPYIANLLEQEIANKQIPPAEVAQTRLLAHHMRRTLNPDQYLEKFLAPRLTPAELTQLQEHLKRFEGLQRLFSDAQKPLSAEDALAFLKTKRPNSPLLKRKSVQAFETAFQGGDSWWTWAKSWFDGKNSQQYRLVKQWMRHPDMAVAKQATPKACENLLTELKTLLGDPHALPQSAFSQKIKGLTSAKELQKLLQNGSIVDVIKDFLTLKPRASVQRYRNILHYGALDQPLEAVLQDAIIPLSKKTNGLSPKLMALVDDITHSKLNLLKMRKVYDTGNIWVKLALSSLLLFISYGVVTNIIDNKILQPAQRKIVKERGDSTEFLIPGFLGPVVGLVAFIGMVRQPWIQRLGYISSFAVSGLSALAVSSASTYAMFMYKISKPRKPEAPKVVTPPKPQSGGLPQWTPSQLMAVRQAMQQSSNPFGYAQNRHQAS